jgi:tetratricopeptide (TPR) repeat protein
MQYCDQLDEKDLKSFGVGKVLCGGFYRRAGTIEGTRGINDKLWFKAVGALNEALKLKPDLSLARANLGVAYLLHPEGTNSEKAEEYLQSAADAVMEDKTLDPLSRATTLVNFAVAQLARGSNKEAMKFLAKAAEVSKELKGAETTVLAGALRYNSALALSGSPKEEEKAQALTLMEQYLGGDDSNNSYWWPVGYERYTELCKALKREPKSKDAFASRREPILRMQATVTLKDGKTVSLAEDVEPVLKRLGKHTVSELADAALKRYRFEEHGIEVLASDRVIAIVLSLPTSPALKIRSRGVGGKEVEIKVGMTGKELLEKMPGAMDFVFRELTFPKEEYYYYRHLGLAINFDSFPGGKVTELILVQIPG